MRKKTIKFYFFNNYDKNPSMHYLFCFSKKALKQNKQELKLKKYKFRKYKTKKKIESIQYFTNFKNKINFNIKANQWSKNGANIIYFFLKSFFLKQYDSNHKYFKKIIIKLWFVFKNKFYKYTNNYLSRFSKLGFLSSHFVHILSRKNVMYQTRSKYRSKNKKLNYYNYYIYNYTKFIHLYLHNLNTKIYFFTTNITHKNIWLDNDFNIITSLWSSSINNTKKPMFVNLHNRNNNLLLDSINTHQYNNDTIFNICKNLQIINDLLIEADKKKIEELYMILSQKLDNNTLNYIHIAKLFIQGGVISQKNYYNMYLIYTYNQLFLHIINK